MAQQPLVGQGLLIIEASRSYSDTSHSSGRFIIPSQGPLPDNTQTPKRETSMLPAGFEPVISASEWLQTDALNPEATGTGYESLESDKDLGI